MVVTLKGRAYYKILDALKRLDIKFISITPAELKNMHLGSSLIITTEEERGAILHNNILLDSELEQDPAIIKAKILHNLSNSLENTLLIGVDPGKRIGISILYRNEEIDSRVITSIDRLVEIIEMLIENIKADKVIVRIGSGDLKLALKIASKISYIIGFIDIELVDEYGTSINAKPKAVRDRLSARAIAYRNGRNFKEYISYTHS